MDQAGLPATTRPVDPHDLRKDVIGFRTRNHFGNGETIAAYANSADLGFGREMHCQRHKVAGLTGFDVACYVTNYGNKDSDDFDDFLQALAASKDDPKTGPHVGAIATVGMEYSRIEDPSNPNKFVSNQRVVKFYVWARSADGAREEARRGGRSRRLRPAAGSAAVRRLPRRRLRGADAEGRHRGVERDVRRTCTRTSSPSTCAASRHRRSPRPTARSPTTRRNSRRRSSA